MKRLLLTSGGIRNKSITGSLRSMLDRPFFEATVCFITTASVAEPGNHDWFINDLNRVYALGWRSFDILDLSGIPNKLILARLGQADVIYVEGGNTYHLMKSIIEKALERDFLQLLEEKVYVGVSAGSMIFSKDAVKRLVELYGDNDAIFTLNDKRLFSPFNLFDWFLLPHANNGVFPQPSGFPIYAIDDQTAISIVGTNVEVISEGDWKYIE